MMTIVRYPIVGDSVSGVVPWVHAGRMVGRLIQVRIGIPIAMLHIGRVTGVVSRGLIGGGAGIGYFPMKCRFCLKCFKNVSVTQRRGRW